MIAKRYEENFEFQQEQPVVQAVPRRKTKLNTRLRSKCLLFLVAVSVMAMAVTLLSGVSASRGYALVQAKQQAASLEAENGRLRLEIAQLKSPQRIQQIATKQLGMVVSKDIYYAAQK